MCVWGGGGGRGGADGVGAVRFRAFIVFCPVLVFLLCLLAADHSAGVEGATCFAFLWFVTCWLVDLLPPKPKLSFRYLKQGIQEFHKKYVLAAADKAANNVVVVWRLYYINTLIQELGNTKTYERIPADERSIVNAHTIDITAKFAMSITEKARQTSYVILVTDTS